MADMPWFKLYPADWIKDTRGLTLEAKGAWFDLICYMWIQGRTGEITDDIDGFARMLSCQVKDAEFALNLLERKKVCDVVRSPNGEITITNRRMKKESSISETRAKNGSKGGKKSRKTISKDLYNLPGYLYIMADLDKPSEFKIGISKDPAKRIYGVRRDTGRQNLAIIEQFPVEDMGAAEMFILTELKEYLDGEWGIFQDQAQCKQLLSKTFSKYQAKIEQNPDFYPLSSESNSDSDFKEERGVGREENPLTLPAGGYKPGADHLDLELPELKIGAVQQLHHFTNHSDLSPPQVINLWEVFKVQNFTGEKWYNSTEEIYSHFINWSKNQKVNGTAHFNDSRKNKGNFKNSSGKSSRTFFDQ